MLNICFYARSVIRWRTPENLQDNLFFSGQIFASGLVTIILCSRSSRFQHSLLLIADSPRHATWGNDDPRSKHFLSWAPVRAWISENLSQNIFMSHIVSSRRDRKYVYLLGITTLLSTYNQLVTTLTLSILKNWKQIAPGSSDRAETFSRKTCSRYSRS